jgi:L-xylulokinase
VNDLLLGIDCGSSVTKAALYDLEGHELATSSSRTELFALPNGGAERSTLDVWESVIRAVRAVVATTHAHPTSVIGVGCSGHGNGLYAIDAHGEPLPRAYQSIDTRADAIVHEWAGLGFAEALFDAGWQRPWSGQPLAILEWLRRHDPDTYAAMATIMLCKDFVNHRLAGREVTDYSDMSAAGLLANAGRGYNTALLDLVGLEEVAERLPELVASSDVIGGLSEEAARALGLTAGIPVVGGLFDVAASSIGSGGAATGTLSLVAGTWSIATVVTREPIIDRTLLMTTAFADAKRWMAIEASATSAANLDWFVREAWVDDRAASEGSVFERCCRVAATASTRLSSPLYHPFLFGSPSDRQARAGFYGIAGTHTRADLARAVLEGVAFGLRQHVDDLVAAGARPERIRLSGGCARSELWSQMIADVLGMPIEVPDAEEAGARGAALAAGVGVGAYPDIDAAMARATRVARSHRPDPGSTALHAQRYELYRALTEALEPTWRLMALDAPAT